MDAILPTAADGWILGTALSPARCKLLVSRHAVIKVVQGLGALGAQIAAALLDKHSREAMVRNSGSLRCRVAARGNCIG